MQLSPAAGRGGGRARTAAHSPHRPGIVLDQIVLVVKAGHRPVRNLSEPIKLTFKHNLEVNDKNKLSMDYTWKILSFRVECGFECVLSFRWRMGLVCFGRSQTWRMEQVY